MLSVGIALPSLEPSPKCNGADLAKYVHDVKEGPTHPSQSLHAPSIIAPCPTLVTVGKKPNPITLALAMALKAVQLR